MRASAGELCFIRILVVVALVVEPLIVAVIAEPSFDSPATFNASAHQQQPVEEENVKQNQEVNLNAINKNLFKRLFKQRRKEHIEAIKSLQRISSYEHQYKLINLMSEKIFNVLESKKNLLDNFTESQLANISFSNTTDAENDIKDAMSTVLENTAFFGDVVLNLPDITQRVLKTLPQWNDTMRWSFSFLNKTREWVDNSTMEMAHLALQELNITQRDPNYVNPKRVKKSKPPTQQKKKKEKRKKGPMITKIEL